MQQKVNLLDYDPVALQAWLCDLGEKPFRATQLLKWIHQRGISDFALMTDLSLALRSKMCQVAEVRPLTVANEQLSADGTRKWLLQLCDGNHIETVFIPESTRGTLCVSSQVGCALNCSFCATGMQGFNRNLSVAEIIAQLYHAVFTLERENSSQKITNVVFMGMGEPLLNYDNVCSAASLMMADNAYGLSKYRVTLSTSGVLPQLVRLGKESDMALAVSLHASNDALRNQLVPINKKYPLAQLMAVCRDYYPSSSQRRITFEYVMLDQVNDSEMHAKQLTKLLAGIPAKVNLIPFNAFALAPYRRSPMQVIDRFRDILMKAGLVAVTRKTRGDDIDAACGQLRGQFTDRTQRSRRILRDQQRQRDAHIRREKNEQTVLDN